MSTALLLSNVVKRYGPTRALDGLTLAVPRGATCGLVGPNGAGKTTLMGVAAGLLSFESGTVDVLGHGPFRAAVHAGRLGLMPQDSSPSVHLSLTSILAFYAELGGRTRAEAKRDAERWLDEVQLGPHKNKRYGELSHGMRRRFSIAQAFLGEPELVLLDEPTSGLDPDLVVSIRELIKAQGKRRTLVVSSHVLSDLEQTCDHVVMIERGRCIRQGTLGDVRGEQSTVRITLTRAPDVATLSAQLPECRLTWSAPHLTVKAPATQPVEETNRRCLTQLLAQGVGVLEVQTGQSLEASYMEARRGSE